MYEVLRNQGAITVGGPSDFSASVNPESVGVVLRSIADGSEPVKCTIECKRMTNAEIVAMVLELVAYPE